MLTLQQGRSCHPWPAIVAATQPSRAPGRQTHRWQRYRLGLGPLGAERAYGGGQWLRL